MLSYLVSDKFRFLATLLQSLFSYSDSASSLETYIVSASSSWVSYAQHLKHHSALASPPKPRYTTGP